MKKAHHTTSKINIAVVGGTPFDSGKGARYLAEHQITAQAIGLSAEPSQQAELYQDPNRVKQKFDEAAGSQNFSDIIIYCNSLSFIADWPTIYPHRIYELTYYWKPILQRAPLDKLAIIVAEESTVVNLQKMVEREQICDSQKLQVFPDINLINKLEASTEKEQLAILSKTLESYANQGFTEVLMGCTHLDQPQFSNHPKLKVHQPGLTMLDEFIADYQHDCQVVPGS